MIKSLEISAEGLSAQVLKNDVVANNLANLTTSAFKKELTRFSREITEGSETTRDLVVSSATDFTAGPMTRTDNPLDLAIEGRGFFVVDTGEGERYTRDGKFTLDDRGVLVTRDGHEVQGSSGVIQVDITEGDIVIATDGTVSVAGIPQGAVRVVEFSADVKLTRESANLYRAPDGVKANWLRDVDIAILPGHVEGSNVNPLKEMVDMISALRTFQVIEQSIKSSDEILDTMINQVARVPSGS